jgi:hypothetical protein
MEKRRNYEFSKRKKVASLMNTRVLLRAAAVATLLTTIRHLTGSPHLLGSLWAPTNAQQGSDVVRAMQAYRFEAMGFETSVFNFYSGFGWQLGAYLLGHAIFIWLLADISSALSAVKLRVIIGVLFLEFLAATLLALLTWKSFWIPAAANGVPAAFLAAAWIAGRPHTAESGSGLMNRAE